MVGNLITSVLSGLVPGGPLVKSALSFLGSRAGKWALVGLALLAWTVYHRWEAASDARTSCRDAFLQEQLDERQRQLDIAEQIAREAEERADLTAEEAAALREVRDALQAELANAPDSCAIPDDLRERLRNIR